MVRQHPQESSGFGACNACQYATASGSCVSANPRDRGDIDMTHDMTNDMTNDMTIMTQIYTDKCSKKICIGFLEIQQ